MDYIVQQLTQQFKEDRGLTSLSQAEAFEAFAGFCVLSAFFEEQFQPDAFRMGGGNDLGIDVAGIVINGELMRDAAEVSDAVDQAKRLDVRFVIVQAKTSAGFEAKVFTDLADNLMRIFQGEPLPYPASDDVRDLCEAIQAIYQDVSKISHGLPQLHVRYVSTGTTGDVMVSAKAKAAAERLTSLNLFEAVDVQPVGARELRELYKRATEAVSVTFAMPKRITMPRIPGVDQAFLGVLPAMDVVDMVTDPSGGIRKGLFFENVRDFQGDNAVNSEIRQTLTESPGRDRFAVFNNGITVVARELSTAGDDFRLKDFQIVNGCQTCHVLFEEREQLTEGVSVNVKLIQSRDEEVIAGIIAATNRQTAVSDDDLAAREQFHKDLEEYVARQPEPRRLYYERRSRQYADRREINKTRIITRPILTRGYVSMFLDDPARAGRYTQMRERHGGRLFQRNQHLRAYYAAASAWYRLEWLLRNGRIDRGYGPARYHILAAIKTYLLGEGPLPQQPKAAEKACDKIIDVMWRQVPAEDLVATLLPAIDLARREEKVELSEMVRTQRFADRVRREVLRLRGTVAP
jgi:hypothetical protein